MKIAIIVLSAYMMSSIALFSQIQRISLSEISFQELTIVRKVKDHIVYKSEHEYIKLWLNNSRHFHNDRNKIFIDAVESGFFEGIAPIKAVLFDNDRCVGYMTHTCAAPCDFKFRIDTIKQLQPIIA